MDKSFYLLAGVLFLVSLAPIAQGMNVDFPLDYKPIPQINSYVVASPMECLAQLNDNYVNTIKYQLCLAVDRAHRYKKDPKNEKKEFLKSLENKIADKPSIKDRFITRYLRIVQDMCPETSISVLINAPAQIKNEIREIGLIQQAGDEWNSILKKVTAKATAQDSCCVIL